MVTKCDTEEMKQDVKDIKKDIESIKSTLDKHGIILDNHIARTAANEARLEMMEDFFKEQQASHTKSLQDNFDSMMEHNRVYMDTVNTMLSKQKVVLAWAAGLATLISALAPIIIAWMK